MALASAMPQEHGITELGGGDSKATDAFDIEQIFRRAHQIHREHGGFFGYDFEDWVQAWRDVPQTVCGNQMEQVSEYSRGFVSADGTATLEPCFGCGN